VIDTTTDSSAGPHTAESLAAWLIGRVAAYTRLSEAEIDPAAPLTGYGLDSVAALSLCGDIEDEFDLIVEPTVAWDHPTVDALVGHLLGELGQQPGNA
jgi:acyl carrier protein